MISQEQAINQIVQYLIETVDRGIVYKPNATKGIECFVDADFSVGWNQIDANNAENIISRTDYVIT